MLYFQIHLVFILNDCIRYGHWKCADDDRKRLKGKIQKTVVLRHGRKSKKLNSNIKIVFWSGGKDSFLTFNKIAEDSCKTIFLTTFNPETGVVPEQDIQFDYIIHQAKALKVDLVAVPLPLDCPNDIYISTIEDALNLICETFNTQDITLCFGDLHLEEIRKWRESCFSKYKCEFPLFNANYEDLVRTLNSLPAEVVFSKINYISEDSRIEVGKPFNIETFLHLHNNTKIDAFGENGEFHTWVKLKEKGI